MSSRLMQNPQAVNALYELIELGFTAGEVKESFEALQDETKNGPDPEEETLDIPPLEFDPDFGNYEN